MLVAILVGEGFPLTERSEQFLGSSPGGEAVDKRRTKEAERSTIDIWRRIFSDSIGEIINYVHYETLPKAQKTTDKDKSIQRL